MTNSDFIKETEAMIKKKVTGEGSGHDWWHIWRVWHLSKRIAKEENADSFIVEMAALLHDIEDWKSNDGDPYAGGRATKVWLEKLGVEEPTINKIVKIVDNVSFKGAGVSDKMDSLEGKVVQDADRLDALGAMGIGRAFIYGGHKGRAMHDPDMAVQMADDFEVYKSAGQTTINHFYEKLLLLKDRMHTDAAKKIAKSRHEFVEKFLEEFHAEWTGER
jgi:uncharacterized protein